MKLVEQFRSLYTRDVRHQGHVTNLVICVNLYIITDYSLPGYDLR